MKNVLCALLLSLFLPACSAVAVIHALTNDDSDTDTPQKITQETPSAQQPDLIALSERQQTPDNLILIPEGTTQQEQQLKISSTQTTLPMAQFDDQHATPENTLSMLKDKLRALRQSIHQTELSLLDMKSLVKDLEMWQMRLQQQLDAAPITPVQSNDMQSPISLQQKQSDATVPFDALQIIRNITPEKHRTKITEPKQIVKALRLGKDYNKVRVVMDFEGMPDIRHAVTTAPEKIIIKLPETAWKAKTSYALKSGIIKSYQAHIIDEASQTVQLTMLTAPGARLDRTFTLTDRQPYRLVIDIVK